MEQLASPGLGRLPSPKDDRDHTLGQHVRGLSTIQQTLPSYSYFRQAIPVMNQGTTSMCVAYSGSIIRTISQRKDAKQLQVFDAPELYARCKEQDGIPNQDGTFQRVAAEILLNRGAIIIQSPDAGDIGTTRKIAAYARLRTVDEIRASVYLFGAAWLGSWWYQNWFEVPSSDWYLPEPDQAVGGHAYAVDGYSDRRKAFRIHNSWGPTWGNNGHAWLRYSYIKGLEDDNGDFEAWRTLDVLGDG